MKLFVAGISHKTAPVQLREQLAVKQPAIVDLAFVLKCFGHLDEIVLLSTCNRIEIYGTSRHGTAHVKSVLQLLCPEPRDLDAHIYLHEGAAAACHLLRVAAGLDSMMIGETEITGQIKDAYEIAVNAGLTGRVLNRLFQSAFNATKKIRTRTRIGRGAVSIKSAAVALAERIFGEELVNKAIMVIGAGQMAEHCVRSLIKKGVRSIFVSNRSFDRAIDLTTRFGGNAVCFGDCLFQMRNVDLVITATNSSEPLLDQGDAENLVKSRHGRPLSLIDLSVPRNVSPAVGGLKNVTLYNIDDLEALALQGVRARAAELAACDEIIGAHVAAVMEKLYFPDRDKRPLRHHVSPLSNLLWPAA